MLDPLYSWYRLVQVSPFTLHLGPIRRECVGLKATKPGFGISDKAILKPFSSATETSLKIGIVEVTGHVESTVNPFLHEYSCHALSTMNNYINFVQRTKE